MLAVRTLKPRRFLFDRFFRNTFARDGCALCCQKTNLGSACRLAQSNMSLSFQKSIAMDLSDEEIDNICSGYRQGAAKVRYLQSLGLTVRRKPNGRPLVNRAHYNSVMGSSAGSAPTTVNNLRLNQCEPVWGVH